MMSLLSNPRIVTKISLIVGLLSLVIAGSPGLSMVCAMDRLR